MISCKEVSSRLLTGELKTDTWWLRTQIRVHLAMCRHCSRLARQLRQISIGARAVRKDQEPDAAMEERLLRRLANKSD